MQVLHSLAMKALPPEDIARRRERALLFARSMLSERRFGYWRWLKQPSLPMPIPRQANVRTEGHFQILEDIERYAGSLVIDKYPHALCRICVNNKGRGGGTSARDEREFIIVPGPQSKFIYRWPGSLSHYYREHKIEAPEWLPLLTQEFQHAKARGFWI